MTGTTHRRRHPMNAPNGNTAPKGLRGCAGGGFLLRDPACNASSRHGSTATFAALGSGAFSVAVSRHLRASCASRTASTDRQPSSWFSGAVNLAGGYLVSLSLAPHLPEPEPGSRHHSLDEMKTSTNDHIALNAVLLVAAGLLIAACGSCDRHSRSRRCLAQSLGADRSGHTQVVALRASLHVARRRSDPRRDRRARRPCCRH